MVQPAQRCDIKMTIPIEFRNCPNCNSSSCKTKLVEPPFHVVQCRNCDLVYLVNPPDQNTLYEEYYTASNYSAGDYRRDSAIPALAEMHAINTQRMQWIRKLNAAGRLLDIGCGRGYFLKTAHEQGFEVSGIEISAQAVDIARIQMKVEAAQKTLEEMQNTSEEFDVITLWHVLEHFHDPFDALQRVRKLLTKNGACFVEVPNWHSLKFMLASHKWQGGNHPRYHRSFFTAKTLARAFQKSGYSRWQRLQASYRLPGQNSIYWLLKRACNTFAMDAFLTYAAWK
jgi:ubiquinone/menaquinone biosynthesis C-methylase UbiE